MNISDSTFIKQFENLTLAPEHFDHIGHLRLAWLYLNKHPLETAISKTTVGISNYATSLGATDKFQRTLTEAIVRIMAMRFENADQRSFDRYLSDNRDLVEDLWSVIQKYYTIERINSDMAKVSFVEPDLKPFN